MPVPAGYARDHEPCVIFMDEIDAIGGRRSSGGSSADREIQRTLMELLNQVRSYIRTHCGPMHTRTHTLQSSVHTHAHTHTLPMTHTPCSYPYSPQLDGFDSLGKVKVVMATNRPDILDPALMRPGRLDRKVEIPLPNEASRHDILKIHAAKIAKKDDIGPCMGPYGPVAPLAYACLSVPAPCAL